MYLSWLCCPLERKLVIIQKKIIVLVIVRLIMVVVMVILMIFNLAIMMRGKTYGGTRLEVEACHKTITCD